jgi:hypothetical protein
MLKSETLAIIAGIIMSISMTGLVEVYGQVLERDVEAPALGLNGTASTDLPSVSIDISPLESLPTNGTVTMSLEDVVDTNMNEIPPPGVTVIISSEAVTVTNHEVTIEETEIETEELETSEESAGAPDQSESISEEDGSSGDDNTPSNDDSGDDDSGDDEVDN